MTQHCYNSGDFLTFSKNIHSFASSVPPPESVGVAGPGLAVSGRRGHISRCYIEEEQLDVRKIIYGSGVNLS